MSIETLPEHNSRLANDALVWLKDLSRDIRPKQVGLLCIRLLQVVAQIATFWFFSEVMHAIVVAKQEVFLGQMGPFVGSVGAWVLCVWYADRTSCRVKFSIENELERALHEILRKQQVSITRRFSTTYWQQILLTNVSDVADYLTQYSVQKWVAGIAPLIVLLVILPVNYIVALTLLLTMPIVPLFMVLVGRGAAVRHRKHFLALERLGDMFSDRLKGLSLITATGQHSHQLERLDHASNVVNRKTMSVVSLAFLNSTVLDFFSTVSIALVAVFIGFSMLGELTFGPKISLHHGLFMLLVAPLLFAELRLLGKFYHQKAKAEAGAERICAVFRDAKKKRVSVQPEGVAWLNFRVQVPSLHAERLTIRSGEWIRVEGASGSGKTSLLEALMGFREASHVLSGKPALLTQKSCVLDDTLAFNLHLGYERFAEQDLIRSLGEVGLTEWFEALPNGLATTMSDSPSLSGGEAQRLALARILLLGKDVVLLDEPTAHLTHEQHMELSELIRDKLRGKTVLWSSHKQLPDAWFDQHWWIEQGEIEVRK